MRRILFQFTPLEGFFSEEFKSDYIAGLTYTVHEGNEKLQKAAQAWIKEGKCFLGTPPAGAELAKSKISGKGKVG